MKKLNSLTLLICLILFMAAVLMTEGIWDAVFAVATTLVFVRMLGCPLRKAVGPVLSIWPFFIFILLLNVLFGETVSGETGRVFLSWWIFTLTEHGITMGLRVVMRCVLVSVLASAYIAVSSPLVMTDAMSRLISPLRFIGLPVERLSFIVSMSLFFIPEMKDEAERILKAERARGAAYGGNGLIGKARSFLPMIIPLFVSALRRADSMSRALVSRGYNGDSSLRKRKKLEFTLSDLLALSASMINIFIIKGAIR